MKQNPGLPKFIYTKEPRIGVLFIGSLCEKISIDLRVYLVFSFGGSRGIEAVLISPDPAQMGAR